ncbi:MAG: formate dehydrogenase accessory sulfurtransferase FdhD, partial [Smithellaceae bacterium]|nr:formate dehydrogenase accessory sulfurtransferase FdhD [Smithellaceae bacterium]
FNGKALATIACLGSHGDELAVGYLRSEGFIRDRADVRKVETSPDGLTVWITAASSDREVQPEADRVKAIGSSGSKGTVKGSMVYPLSRCEENDKRLYDYIEPLFVIGLMDKMIAESQLHRRTGGTHSAALADCTGLLAVREDIGRHNAIDMLSGYALLYDLNCTGKIIVRTGRVSAEIVSKLLNMGIRFVISISVPTAAAVRLARETEMTLVGSVRGGKMTVYSQGGWLQKR